MYTIHLDKLQFFAHHGFHDEEAVTGTNFEISVSIRFEAVEVASLRDTVNYAEAYAVIKQHMAHPVALLEVLAQQIAAGIYTLDERIRQIDISIYKLHPPIMNFSGKVGITFSKSF